MSAVKKHNKKVFTFKDAVVAVAGVAIIILMRLYMMANFYN